MKTSFKPTFLLIGGRILSFAISFLFPIVLVRIFDQALFGAYKQVFLTYVILYGIAQMGMAESLYYFVPLHRDHSGRIVLNSTIVLALSGLLCVGALIAFKSSVAGWLGNPAVAPYLPMLGVFLWLMLITAVLEIVMTARKQYLLAACTYAGSDLLKSLFLIVPVIWFQTLFALLAGAIIFATLRLLFTIGYLVRQYGDELTLDWQYLRLQIAYTIPFELAVIVEVTQANYHQYAVSHYFGPIVFATYAVGCLQLPFLDFVAAPTCNVMMVRMAEEAREHGDRGVLSVWRDTTRKLALIFLPLFALLVIMAREIILLLFTDRYAAAIPVFSLWAIIVPLAVFQTDGLLRAQAQTRFILFLNAIRLGLITGLIGFCLSTFGLKGAVLITLLASAANPKRLPRE